MRKTITLLTILLLVVFMVGCENAVNPIITDNPSNNVTQSDNNARTVAKPFIGEFSNPVANVNTYSQKSLRKSSAWHIPGDFANIQEANDAAEVLNGDIIYMGRGNFAGALINKELHIMGENKNTKNNRNNGGKTIIDDGPLHGSGNVQGFRFLPGSDGASLSHLEFRTEGLDIMNGGAVNDVVIQFCEFHNSLQGISNWLGSGWNINNNRMTDLRTSNGGGIGILIADYTGGVVQNNIVENNTIEGKLHVSPTDGGGYAGTGIVMYADFRWGGAGALEIKNNIVTDNKVRLDSDNPLVVDAVGFELTDTRDDDTIDPVVLFDNIVTNNFFKGGVSISLTPENLADYNDISNNHVFK